VLTVLQVYNIPQFRFSLYVH